MADIDERRVNGVAFGWSSAEWKVRDRRVNGFKAIAYKDKRTRSPVYGAGAHHAPIGQTPGKYEPDVATATVLKKTADALRAALAAEAEDGKSFGNVEFEVVVSYSNGGDVIVDELHRCFWVEQGAKAEEAPDALYEEIAFQPTTIEWNGKTLYDGTGGAP